MAGGVREDAGQRLRPLAHDSVISVHVGDGIEEAYEDAKRRGFEIVHPLTTEPWGIRRFLVRAPDGNVINIKSHKDD